MAIPAAPWVVLDGAANQTFGLEISGVGTMVQTFTPATATDSEATSVAFVPLVKIVGGVLVAGKPA